MHRNNTLTGNELTDAKFKKALRGLINNFGIDNALSTPDYILADHVKESLIAIGHTTSKRDRHISKIGVERFVNMDFGQEETQTVYMHHGAGIAPEPYIRCENCDGHGFIGPLTATPAPTLQRWVDQLSGNVKEGFAEVNKLADEAQQQLDHLRSAAALSDEKKAYLDAMRLGTPRMGFAFMSLSEVAEIAAAFPEPITVETHQGEKEVPLKRPKKKPRVSNLPADQQAFVQLIRLGRTVLPSYPWLTPREQLELSVKFGDKYCFDVSTENAPPIPDDNDSHKDDATRYGMGGLQKGGEDAVH